MEKIEFIEVNGQELPLGIFTPEIKSIVTTFEIARDEYNKSVVHTQAIGDYMQRLSQQIQTQAQQHIDNLAAKATPQAPAEEDVDPAE